MTNNRWKRYYQKNREYHLNRNREYYLKRLVAWYEWFDEIEKNRCEICGFDDHPKAIDFHHIVPEDKSFGIGKFACFACSDLHTVFYSTKAIDGFEANAVVVDGRYSDKTLRAILAIKRGNQYESVD